MITLTALSLATVLASNSPDVIMVNKSYALTHTEAGLVCYGCQAEPTVVPGSETLAYGDDVIVEANSAFTAFVTVGITPQCPAGKQYAINLAETKMIPLNVPCGAKDYEWSFSEREVTYRYHYDGKKYAFKFTIEM